MNKRPNRNRGLLIALLALSIVSPKANAFYQTPQSSQDAAILITQADSLFMNSQYQAALGLYNSVLELIEGTDDALKVTALQKKADALINLNRPGTAEQTAQESLDLANQVFGTESQEAASSYYYLGKSLVNQSKRFDQSLAHQQKALEIRKAVFSEGHESVAESLNMIGMVQMYKGEYQKALDTYNEALEIWKQLDEEVIPWERSRTYWGIGWVNVALGNPWEALQVLNKGLAINQKTFHSTHGRISNDLNLIGRCYMDLAQHEMAFKTLEKTVEIRKQTLGEEHPNVAQVYLTMGTLLSTQGLPNNAIDYTLQAIRILEAQEQPNEATLLTAYSNLAVFYRNISFKRERRNALEKAVEIARSMTNNPRLIAVNMSIAQYFLEQESQLEFNRFIQNAEEAAVKFYGNNHPFYSSVVIKKAEANIRFRNPGLALDQAKEALAIVKRRRPQTHPDQVIHRITVARAFYHLNRLDSALAYLSEAIDFAVVDKEAVSEAIELENINTPTYIIEAHYLKALTFKKWYDQSKNLEHLVKALEAYKVAMDHLEVIRNRLIANRAGETLFRLVNNIPNEGLEVAYQLYEASGDPKYAEEFFQISERTKSYIFLKDIDQKQSLRFGNVPDSLIQKEWDLVSQIRYYGRLRRNAILRNQKEQVDKYRKRVFDLRQDRVSLVEKIKEFHPDFYRLKYAPQVQSLAEVQANLETGGEGLVEYTVTKHAIFIQAMTKDSAVLHRYPKDAFDLNELNAFRRSHSDYNFIINEKDKSDSLFMDLGHRFYQQLMAPVVPIMEEVSQLVVVPHDQLYNLNFDLLLTDAVEHTLKYAELPYLTKRFAVTYASSYMVHQRLESIGYKSFKRNFGGFAADLRAERVSISHVGEESNVTVRSPGNRIEATVREVESIADLLNGDRFLNEKATEENFKNLKDDYRVIHLAMHGNVDNNNPFNSALIFNPTPDQTEDGELAMNEIYDLDVKSELVVLSACNSGHNDHIINGEGMVSMSRGFMFSGVPALVMSQWYIPDETTADIMLKFYENLVDGDSKPQALQKAKMGYLAETTDDFLAHPYFWAGISHMGNTSAIDLKRSASWPYALLFVLFAGAAFWSYLKRRSAQKAQ